MTIRAFGPCGKVSTVSTGVPKSCTSRRRCEIARNRCFDEVDDEGGSLLVDVDARRVVGKVDDNAPLAVAAAAEVDVAQAVLEVIGPRLGKTLHLLRLRDSLVALVKQRDQHRVALDVGFECLRRVEIEHDARAAARLDQVEAAQRGVIDRLLRGANAVGGVEEVERDPWGLATAKPAGGLAGGDFSWNLTIVRPECLSTR